MKPIPSPQDQAWNEEIIKTLKRLGSLKAEYPSELFAARRAAFILQVEQQDKSLVLNDQFTQYLESLKTIRAEYPPELLAARRAAFVDRIEHYPRVENTEELHSEDREIIKLFKSLKSVEAEYPPARMAARRAAFRRQLALGGQVSVLEALRTSVRSFFSYRPKALFMPMTGMMRTSLVVIGLMLATFVGSLLRDPIRSFGLPSSPSGIIQSGSNNPATNTNESAKVTCKPGYLPPLCLVKPVDESQDLTFPGNGLARPAVAKDTFPGYDGIHKAAYANDGLYGSGASWVSNSAYSWIKIDLGKPTAINTVAFGKDRLGNSKDGNPGQFVIAVALSDNVYADGNSSNDYVEYTQVYDSKQAGFNGVISGPETVQAQFGVVTVRYIKITFANPGTAVDEVEAFMVKPPALANDPTKRPRENLFGLPPAVIPTSTSAPTGTALPAPTDTPVPADTATPVPTNTLAPTDTPIPVPTDTPVPADTPIPPVPTDTPVPADTPVPPTTNQIQPTDTSIPPAPANPVDVPTQGSISAQP